MPGRPPPLERRRPLDVPVHVAAVDHARAIGEADQQMLLAHGLAFGLRFARTEPWARVGEYMCGLVAGPERKNGWMLSASVQRQPPAVPG